MSTETFDLCVIGAGPAGMIVAIEYARAHPASRVALVEFGADAPSPRNALDDTIQIANSANHHEPYECTNKGLGGTSASWGGRCVMYDEIDFLPRPILRGECTWGPSLLAEAKRYAPRAADYFECGDDKFDLTKIAGFDGGRIADGFKPGPVTDTTVERWSRPTRFGPRYRGELDSLTNITVLTGWRGSGMEPPSSEGAVPSITIRRTADGTTRQLAARNIVLAAGAQESTRLLLANPQIFRQRGGVPESLGRFYQGHVSGKIASVRFRGDPRKTDYGFHRDEHGIYVRRRFQFTTEALMERGLLNTAIWLDNPLYFDPSHRSGAMSFMYLAMIAPIIGKKLAPPAIAHSVTKGKVTSLPAHIGNILRGLPMSLFTPASIFFRRYCLPRKLPGVFLYNPDNRYALHFHAEQVPDAANRMELLPDGETLRISYDLTGADVDSVIRTHELLDGWLRECGCGELEYWFPKEELPVAIRQMSRDGIHQVGTTRIADDPARGVVDANLCVWGTTNVFVCSSSAFPTSGQANPTFLLGAFAVRLAEHLKKALRT
ncbi:MAG: GMC oxidoreductase [Terrimicrobiaceae bacterium]|nr:GMC oxidoreductase [Terrimicrobiaceae bacterium]